MKENKNPASTEVSAGKGEREDKGKIMFSLYKINSEIQNIIESSVNPETGEIAEEPWQALERLTETRIALAEDIGLYFKQLQHFVDSCKAEKDRITLRQKQAENFQERIKKLLGSVLAEKVKLPNLEIGFIHNDIVTTDPWFEIDDLEKTNPDLVRVKITKELDKTEVKKLAKTGVLPSGVRVEKKKNVVIK